MNIALATIALFILLTPGLLFRRLYYSEEFSKEYFRQSYLELFFSSIIPSLLLHVIGYFCFVAPKHEIDPEIIGTLLSGSDDANRVTHAFNSIFDDAKLILEYFFSLYILAISFGYSSKRVIRATKLDRKLKLFRFQNEWHYLFSGEILDFPRVSGKSEDVDFSYVDVLVKSDEGSIIYMGILADYILSKEGGLDRIYLRDVKRRYLVKDKPVNDENPYYQMPGEFFVISAQQIINIHITYYSVSIDDTSLQAQLDRTEID